VKQHRFTNIACRGHSAVDELFVKFNWLIGGSELILAGKCTAEVIPHDF